MRARHQRLYINVDHVATLRQARGGNEPDPVEAAAICESAGADGITAHLREDRRHIQDADVEALATRVTTFFNLETATADEMLEIALRLHPPQVTLVPERRKEITTEGGLDVSGDLERVQQSVRRLREAGIRVSLFIDPTSESTRASHECGADAVEFHTGQYSLSGGSAATLDALARSAKLAAELGLSVHAGHGLTVANVAPVAAIPEIEELNIGHSIVSRAVFVGLPAAVREIRSAMDAARRFGDISE
jgi:pyridoxine 5-phosphate synthase